MTEEVDAQAFLSGEPEVVCRLRAELILQLEWAGPEATEVVLAEVATVPHQEDVAAYLAEAMPVAEAALTAAIQPRIDAMQAAVTSAQAELRGLAELYEKSMRELLRRMTTSKTIQ